MSWIENTACPKCGSRDNLGKWEDGSAWCFGCHYYKPPSKSIDVLKRQLLISNKLKSSTLPFPEDAYESIPKKAIEWVSKYHLTKEEITKLNLLYSQEKELLIFPFVNANRELIAWQGRYFGDKPNFPKYLTYGTKDFLCLFEGKENPETVSVVEDVISAIKVARVTDSMALLGSHLSLTNANRLAKRYKKLIIWLDPNKMKEALNFGSKYSTLFEHVKIVYSQHDPKEYKYDEIYSFII